MRITFILPFVNEGGGIRVIFEHALRLIKKGHQVEIIYPGPTGVSKPYGEPERTLRSLKYWLDNILGKKEYGWFGINLPVRRVPDLRASHIPNADLVIASSNEVADWVNDYPARCGKKVYFIQDYENWSREIEKVDKTWKYSMSRIVISDWLKDLGEKKFGVSIEGVVPNGVDFTAFYPDPDVMPSERPVDILMIYRQSTQKGCDRALKILNNIKKEKKDTTFVFFGLDEAPKDLLDLGQYYLKPTQDQIRKLYSSARIFLLPSFQEGYCLTRMEASACGTAVITTDAGAELDLFEGSGWIVPAQDNEALEKALLEALDKPEQCDFNAKLAKEKVSRCSWDNATDILEKILLNIFKNA